MTRGSLADANFQALQKELNFSSALKKTVLPDCSPFYFLSWSFYRPPELFNHITNLKRLKGWVGASEAMGAGVNREKAQSSIRFPSPCSFEPEPSAPFVSKHSAELK